MIKELKNRVVNKKTKKQLIKYFLISAIGYSFVFISLYLFVDVLKMDKTVSFLIVYGIVYVFLYTIQLKYLFRVEHNLNKVIRFCIALLSFYICANLLYNIGLRLNVHYLISKVFTIAILMPLRFIVAKLYVYRN